MIKVFKTNIDEKKNADWIVGKLMDKYLGFRITVDTDDCDNVLRVEGSRFNTKDIIIFVRNLGFHCEELV